MRHKINQWCNHPLAVLAVAAASLIAGGALGALAYYGRWLG